jgi:LysM repeat protein
MAILTLLNACSSPPSPPTSPAPAATRSGNLTLYVAPSVTPTPVVISPVTVTPLPSPTPTPRTHTVTKGEDMFGIAWRYRVTLEELKAANPEVNPNFLSIGAVLIIPFSDTPLPGEVTATEPAAATPIPVALGPLRCHRAEDGGAWCFQQVLNNNTVPLESISALFQITANLGETIVSETAFLPLDILPPGASLPLVAYFSAGLFEGDEAEIQGSSALITALLSPNDGRYLPAAVSNKKVMLAENGLSAVIQAEIMLTIPETAAQRVWVAAVAYNAQGDVIGVRRWEKPPELTLDSQTPLPVTINIYSVSGEIERVSLIAEARP